MSEPSREDRRQALERAVFARDEPGGDIDLRQEALSAACGITDPALLGKLVDLGLHSETLTAISMVPLVAVAWADGTLAESERRALLAAAAQAGIEGAGLRLLTRWLDAPPGPGLVETWTDYLRATAGNLGPDGRMALRVILLGRARQVAEVAGDLLGHAARITPAEEAMLARLERAFA